MEEIWKPVIVDGVEFGNYEISNLGRVKSLNYRNTGEEKLLKLVINKKNGYVYVNLKKDSKQNFISIHRIVAFAFIPNPINKKCVNHKNSNRTDNTVSNLEWVTHSENNLHGYKYGKMFSNGFKGEENNFSKLTEKHVKEIRKLYNSNKKNMVELSKEFDVCSDTIFKIIDNIYWIDENYKRERTGKKLSVNDVKEIRSKYKTKHYSHRKIAEEYGVGKSTIKQILDYKTWKNI